MNVTFGIDHAARIRGLGILFLPSYPQLALWATV